jgi:hypothetical protein
LQDFVGTYEEYVERCGDDHLDAEVAALNARRERRRERERERRGPEPPGAGRERRRLERERQAVTAAIEKAEARVHEINEIFCDPAFFAGTERGRVRTLEVEQERLKAEIEDLMAAWERLEEELAALA